MQRVNPDKSFVLRVDPSKYAEGAVVEQFIDVDQKPTLEDVRASKNVFDNESSITLFHWSLFTLIEVRRGVVRKCSMLGIEHVSLLWERQKEREIYKTVMKINQMCGL